MENIESAFPRTEIIRWRVVLGSFLIWFFVPLGTDKLCDSMKTADYGRLVGTLVLACIATYFVLLTRAKRGN
jgi:hypothetical protein